MLRSLFIALAYLKPEQMKSDAIGGHALQYSKDSHGEGELQRLNKAGMSMRKVSSSLAKRDRDPQAMFMDARRTLGELTCNIRYADAPCSIHQLKSEQTHHII